MNQGQVQAQYSSHLGVLPILKEEIIIRIHGRGRQGNRTRRQWRRTR